MILMIVVAVAVIGFLATYVWDHFSRRRRHQLAERAVLDPSVRAGRDEMSNPVAAEVVLREGWRPHDSSGGPF